MMFHVKPFNRTIVFAGIAAVLLLTSCGVRQRIQIPDYILVPNGKENSGGKVLTAFVFENNLKNLPFEQYLSIRFKTDNYLQNEIWISIATDKYKLIIYDNDEFEKYIGSGNYAVVNEEPTNAKQGNERKFIAISMINANNEDCLADGSLFQNIAVKFLKEMKDEYYKL